MTHLPAIARATDWLTDWGHSISIAADAGALLNQSAPPDLGLITFLVSRLDRSTLLWRPSDAELEPLRPALSVVPPQLVYLSVDSTPGLWLGLAALAEFRGAGPLARFVVDCLGHRLDASLNAEVGDVNELRGICWTRRGRIARLAGALDDAMESYHEALRHTRRLPWRDAWPNAQLGLANVEIARGNYPAAQQRMVRLLKHRDAVHPIYRVSAYQTLANTRRKNGNLLGALLDGWTAFDLLTPEDPRRDEVLISMAETALEVGDPDAAFRAFTEVMAHPLVLRVQIAAATGALRAMLQMIRTCGFTDALSPPQSVVSVNVPLATSPSFHFMKTLMVTTQRVEALLALDAAPRERAYMLLTLADGACVNNDGDGARAHTQKAAELAATYGFHDYAFRADALLAQLSSPTPLVARTDASEPVRPRVLAHSALSRLRALSMR